MLFPTFAFSILSTESFGTPARMLGWREYCSNHSVSTSVHKMGTSASRILPPWDLLRRGCVFKDRGVLLVEDEMCDLTYAPNCATFSRAREIPTRGVKSCPPGRSGAWHPFRAGGYVKRGLKRLTDDTKMADLSANRCWERAEKRRAFT